MKNKNGKQLSPNPAQIVASSNPDKFKSIRGSGFTYDEAQDRKDKSVQVKDVKHKQVVKLPDLGKPMPK